MADELDELEDDTAFLNYVDLHSKTPRALFHGKHVERFYRLAGWKVTQDEFGDQFYTMRDQDIGTLMSQARKNVEEHRG